MKKKVLAGVLAAMTMVSMAGCGSSSSGSSASSSAAAEAASAAEASADTSTASAAATAATADVADSDVAYIKDKGTLIVGITDFEPMDYATGSALMRILQPRSQRTWALRFSSRRSTGTTRSSSSTTSPSMSSGTA